MVQDLARDAGEVLGVGGHDRSLAASAAAASSSRRWTTRVVTNAVRGYPSAAGETRRS